MGDSFDEWAEGFCNSPSTIQELELALKTPESASLDLIKNVAREADFYRHAYHQLIELVNVYTGDLDSLRESEGFALFCWFDEVCEKRI